jgi:hypothetical protein
MHYGSSEEKDSEEEAGPQDRGGEKVVCEEDRQRPAQEEIGLLRGAGLVPAPPLFSFQINRLFGPSGAPQSAALAGFLPRRLPPFLASRIDALALRLPLHTHVALRDVNENER